MHAGKTLMNELNALENPARATVLQKFFRTAPGEYAEGDVFLGLTVPMQRALAARHSDLSLRELETLLASPVHEHRFCALCILVKQFEQSDEGRREQIFRFYLAHAHCVNNWDLVDASAPYIVGEHLRNKARGLLDNLAASNNLWERRIAIVATLRLIRYRDLTPTFRIAKRLLPDKHDLIHKAVGWALREAGKVSEAKLVGFLRLNYVRMPRTSLRYAIERFPAERRKRMLTGDFS